MRLEWRGFRGEVPALDVRKLPRDYAQVARHCHFHGGTLEALGGSRRVHAPAKAGTGTVRTIHRYAAEPGGDAEGGIATVFNETPVRVGTSEAHGLISGERVFLTGTGLAIDDASYEVLVEDPTHFTLTGTSAAGSAAAGQWTKENGYWFHWTTPVEVVRGPVAGNTEERVYFTGDGGPKMTHAGVATAGGTGDYPTNAYDLGVPAPQGAPTVAVHEPALAIADIDRRDPVRLSVPDHGLATGSEVRIDDVQGMTELNGRSFFITVVDESTFTLDDENGTEHSAYTGGGTATVVGAAQGLLRAVAYAVTYVSALGEEGAPSEPSELIDVAPGQGVTLSGLATGPSSGTRDIDRKRLYRTATSAAGTQFQFVAELALATVEYTDTKTDADLGEVLPSMGWDLPPADLRGLTALTNGVLAGFTKNQVCLSVPYQPHAWPVAYRHTTPHEIVGIGSLGRSVVAITHADAYLVTASTPEASDMEPLNTEQSCVSARGIVSLGHAGVAYPSPDGLVLVTHAGADLVTHDLFTRHEWQHLNPASIHAYLYEGKYVAFYEDHHGERGGFILDPSHHGQGLIRLDAYATAGYRDPLADALYLVVDGHIERWDADHDNRLPYRWRSRIERTPEPAQFSIARVLAVSYDDLTFRLYRDGTLFHEEAVSGAEPFRLPDEDGQDWAVELAGTDEVQRVTVAETVEELS